MLPDIRFAIGAVLAGALLIVTAFGLAATVRVAHHQTVSPFETSRMLAYADPIDWGARPDVLRRLGDPRGNDSLLERLAAIPPDPTVIGAADTRPADREPPGDVRSSEIAAPAEAVATLLAAPAEAQAVAAPDVPVETPLATPPMAAMAEIPATQSPEVTPTETERIAAERVAALPTPDEAVSKAEPSAVPPPAATPPVRAKKPVAKAKKKVVTARKAVRKRTVVRPPTASTGYPVTGSNSGFAGFDKKFFVD